MATGSREGPHVDKAAAGELRIRGTPQIDRERSMTRVSYPSAS